MVYMYNHTEANPEKFNNRIKNKFFYTKVHKFTFSLSSSYGMRCVLYVLLFQMGGKDILQRKFADLTDHITLIVSHGDILRIPP